MERAAGFLRERARVLTNIFCFILCWDVESPGLMGYSTPRILRVSLVWIWAKRGVYHDQWMQRTGPPGRRGGGRGQSSERFKECGPLQWSWKPWRTLKPYWRCSPAPAGTSQLIGGHQRSGWVWQSSGCCWCGGTWSGDPTWGGCRGRTVGHQMCQIRSLNLIGYRKCLVGLNTLN